MASFVKDGVKPAALNRRQRLYRPWTFSSATDSTGSVCLLKIDVEGLEFEVLKGSSQVLKRSPKPIWMVEILPESPMTGKILTRRFVYPLTTDTARIT
jgi:methyltransferase FkbM-like protein